MRARDFRGSTDRALRYLQRLPDSRQFTRQRLIAQSVKRQSEQLPDAVVQSAEDLLKRQLFADRAAEGSRRVRQIPWRICGAGPMTPTFPRD
jgi:hypothetical protein